MNVGLRSGVNPIYRGGLAAAAASPLARSSTLQFGGVTAAVALLVLSTVVAVGIDTGSSGTPGEGVPAFGHVFLILGENTEASSVNATNGAYLLGTLRPMSAWLTNYYALTHHSEANYIGITSGQYTLCEQMDGSPEQCHQGVDNLFHQLDVAGISWRTWLESMPQPCYFSDAGAVSSFNLFDGAHNPAVLYDNVEGSNGAWSSSPSAECLANVIPAGTTGPNDMSTLDAALASGNLPRFNFIVPNECESGEKACPATSDRIAQYDAFLRREVPRVLASPAFGTDGVLIVAFDEGTAVHLPVIDRSHGGGNVAFALVSPLVQPRTYEGFANHYSLLRMLEDGFRLPAYLAGAARAPALAAEWTT